MVTPEQLAEIQDKAKARDYYADLTDEERAEEGLPARETKPDAAADPAPAHEPGDEPKEEDDEDEDEDEDGDGGEEIEADAAAEKIFAELTSLKEQLAEATGKAQPTTKKGEAEILEIALEDDNPAVRALAEELQETRQRLNALAAYAEQQATDHQLALDNAAWDEVMKNYAIGGRPMTEQDRARVERYAWKNKEVGSRLSIEQLTRVVFRDARKVGPRPSPAKGPGGSNGNGNGSVATIIDEGSGSGGGSPEPWKPRPNETVESALKAAGEKLFGLKR